MSKLRFTAVKKQQAILCLLISLFIFASSKVGAASGKIDNEQSKTVFPDHAYVDRNGKVVITCPIETAGADFSNGLAQIKADKEINSVYFIDKTGKVVITGFKEGQSFSEGVAGVGSTNKKGFIDKDGKYVIAPHFQDVEPFFDGLAAVKVNGKFGFIDKSGTIVIDPFFDCVASFSEGLAAVQAEGKIGFIDKLGTWKIKPQFDFVEGFSEGLALVSSGQNTRYIDKLGRVTIQLDSKTQRRGKSTDRISNSSLGAIRWKDWGMNFRHYCTNSSTFNEGLAAIAQDGKHGYINQSGNFIIPPNFDAAFPFNDAIARIQIGNKFGFIDKAGSYIVEPKFLGARDFSEGAAAVATAQNKWGYVDKNGKFLIEPRYSYTTKFAEGLANVQLWGSCTDGIDYDHKSHSEVKADAQALVPKTSNSPAGQANKIQPDQFLKALAPSIRKETFGEFAEVLASSGIVKLHSSRHSVNKMNLVPICKTSHSLIFAEFLETIARQTGTTVKHDERLDCWNFGPPAMKLPYTISVADGWQQQERGYYTAYIPKIAPVGMDIYMMGRFEGLNDQQLKEIRNEQALWFADKLSPGATMAMMNVETVDGCEALSFQVETPVAGRQWRQWAFIKNGQAFVIVSTLDDKNEAKLLPEVKTMISTFHVVK
ncbi:MAG: WG repeat-containing protein [Candidatus Obscuribacterales bacterium]|jgi:hypothetical protein